MDFIKMTVEQLKDYLDEKKVDYSDAKIKADYVLLAEKTISENTEEPNKEPNEESSDLNLADKVKSALTIERTETKKVDDTSYLTGRDYSQLSVGERQLIRERSPEYSSKESGFKVKVTERLATKWRIVKLADKSYSKLLKGVEYTLDQADFEALKNEQVKVKTEATKNKCCGQARYETVDLLEVVNG